LALAGQTGFSSLKILPGVREAGMAGTGVASAFGPQAIALNPAAGLMDMACGPKAEAAPVPAIPASRTPGRIFSEENPVGPAKAMAVARAANITTRKR
jgi:hypothetical protein